MYDRGQVLDLDLTRILYVHMCVCVSTIITSKHNS